jgi:N-acetylmuramoyl-L-alanine amidase
MNIWQGSPEHNANMLNGQFGAIGIGRAYDVASAHGWYWTTIFGDVNDGPGWLCGEVAPASKSAELFQSVDGATAASDINLRTGPADTYELVTTLPPGTQMIVTGAELQSYVPVKVDGQFGWVGAEWIQRGPVSLEQNAAPGGTSEPGTASALQAVELLNAPGADGGVVSTIPAVSVVTLTGQAQDGFLEVVYDGQQGWADAAYLEVANISPNATLLQSAEPTQAQTDAPDAAAAAPVESPGATAGGTALTTSDVNLRSQPNSDAMVISVVPSGSPVSLTGSRANGYVNVRVGGQAGWIDSAYLQQ